MFFTNIFPEKLEMLNQCKELLEAHPDTHRINVINLAHFI
jgi:hypothetical protein